jgi:hypothetical protein
MFFTNMTGGTQMCGSVEVQQNALGSDTTVAIPEDEGLSNARDCCSGDILKLLGKLLLAVQWPLHAAGWQLLVSAGEYS